MLVTAGCAVCLGAIHGHCGNCRDARRCGLIIEGILEERRDARLQAVKAALDACKESPEVVWAGAAKGEWRIRKKEGGIHPVLPSRLC